jgi:hypothetical protein
MAKDGESRFLEEINLLDFFWVDRFWNLALIDETVF